MLRVGGRRELLHAYAYRKNKGTSSALPKGVTPLSVATDEARAAAGFFGPLRIIGSAFAFGLAAGRRLQKTSAVPRGNVDPEAALAYVAELANERRRRDLGGFDADAFTRRLP